MEDSIPGSRDNKGKCFDTHSRNSPETCVSEGRKGRQAEDHSGTRDPGEVCGLHCEPQDVRWEVLS
jgi:hypothetical protein